MLGLRFEGSGFSVLRLRVLGLKVLECRDGGLGGFAGSLFLKVFVGLDFGAI